MFCQKCGTENNDMSTYCSNCGEKLKSTEIESNKRKSGKMFMRKVQTVYI